MAHPSRRSRRRSTRSRRRLGVGLAFGLIATALAIGALVPAFAAATQNAAPRTASATTAPPDTTKPADNPPSETQPDQGSPQQPSKSSGAAVQAASTIVYTGQGTTGGACDTFLDPDESPVTFDPATQQVWQFNLTQTAAGATMSGSFSDGTTVTNKAEDTHTGKVSKWFIVTAKGATVVSASATYTPDGDNSQFVVSHCWGTTTPATGSLTVSKSVAGTPPGGATFTVAVDCNDGSGHDRTLTFDSTGALTGGGPLPITGIPAGTQCSVTETGTGSASSVTYSPGGANPPTVTIAANQQSSVTVTNTYNAPETGSLQVKKVTEGDVPPNTSWQATVTCTSPSFSTVLSFGPNDLGPKTVTGIPLSNGSNSCSVAETDQGTPPPTLVTVTPNSAQSVTTNQTPLFTVTNSYPSAASTGSVSVTKAVTGDGARPSDVQFTVHVSCTDGTEADLIFGSDGGTKQVNGIKIEGNGTNCTVTEPETGQASNVSFSPEDNGKFTLTVNTPTHAITVTNRFDVVEVGGISVTGGAGSVGRIAIGALPFTGSPTAMLLKIAALLIGVGGGALLLARNRRRHKLLS